LEIPYLVVFQWIILPTPSGTVVAFPCEKFGKEDLAMNSGDTTFVLISAALVMLMTPGLALFYGGMVRGKNVLGTIMQSFIVLGVITLQWVLWGYSMSFGPDYGGIIGGLDWFGLKGSAWLPARTTARPFPISPL
jgi:ammonium transporter, Amt family